MFRNLIQKIYNPEIKHLQNENKKLQSEVTNLNEILLTLVTTLSTQNTTTAQIVNKKIDKRLNDLSEKSLDTILHNFDVFKTKRTQNRKNKQSDDMIVTYQSKLPVEEASGTKRKKAEQSPPVCDAV